VTYDAPVAVRLVIVAVAAVAVAALATRLRDHDRCEAARSATVNALFHKQPVPEGVATQQRRLLDNCRDADTLATVSGTLTIAGERRPALALARAATERSPDAFLGWVALARAYGDKDGPQARRAFARAKALNPRLPASAAG
jgi:hypothetical protein